MRSGKEVSAAAHNDAIRLFSHFSQDAALLAEDLVPLLLLRLNTRVEGVPYAYGIGHDGAMLCDLLNIGLGQRCTLRDLRYDFLIVISISQFFSQSPAQLAPAAAKFTAYGNDLAHTDTTFSDFFVYRIIIDTTYTAVIASVTGMANQMDRGPKAAGSR